MYTDKILALMADVLEVETDTIRMEQTLNELEVDSIVFIRLVVQCETVLSMQFEDEMLLISRFPHGTSVCGLCEWPAIGLAGSREHVMKKMDHALSHAQERIWLAQQKYPDSPLFISAASLSPRGNCSMKPCKGPSEDWWRLIRRCGCVLASAEKRFFSTKRRMIRWKPLFGILPGKGIPTRRLLFGGGNRCGRL